MNIIQVANWYFANLKGFSDFSINSKLYLLFLWGCLLDRKNYVSHRIKD
jgi:hypothetical protein